MSVRALNCAAVAVALALRLSSTQAFFQFTPASPITPVAASDRVSDAQLFARHVFISAVNESFYGVMPLSLTIRTPGRVFISYVEQANLSSPSSSASTAANAGEDTSLLGKITVSGSSEAAVAYIDLMAYVSESIDYFIEGKWDVDVATLSATDSLLIEIEVYRKEMINRIQKSGNSDLVVLENVLYTSRDGAAFATSIAMAGDGNGSVFIHDPTATISVESLRFAAHQSGSGNMQIELARLKAIKGFEVSFQGQPHTIAMIVDDLYPISMVVDDLSASDSVLCIATKAEVVVTKRPMFVDGAVSDEATPGVSSVFPAGATCERKPLPERVPALIHQTMPEMGEKPGASSGGRQCSKLLLAIVGWILLAVFA